MSSDCPKITRLEPKPVLSEDPCYVPPMLGILPPPSVCSRLMGCQPTGALGIVGLLHLMMSPGSDV